MFFEFFIGFVFVDYLFINSVVEIIISKECNLIKEVVMIVEVLMEIFFGNYGLVL